MSSTPILCVTMQWLHCFLWQLITKRWTTPHYHQMTLFLLPRSLMSHGRWQGGCFVGRTKNINNALYTSQHQCVTCSPQLWHPLLSMLNNMDTSDASMPSKLMAIGGAVDCQQRLIFYLHCFYQFSIFNTPTPTSFVPLSYSHPPQQAGGWFCHGEGGQKQMMFHDRVLFWENGNHAAGILCVFVVCLCKAIAI